MQRIFSDFFIFNTIKISENQLNLFNPCAIKCNGFDGFYTDFFIFNTIKISENQLNLSNPCAIKCNGFDGFSLIFLFARIDNLFQNIQH